MDDRKENKMDFDTVLERLEQKLSDDDYSEALKLADDCLEYISDVDQALNVSRVFFSEAGHKIIGVDFKKELVLKGLEILSSRNHPYMSDVVRLAQYVVHPVEGSVVELYPGLTVTNNYGLGDKKWSREIILQFLSGILKKDEFIEEDFMPILEFVNNSEGLNDPELARKIVHEGLQMISKKGLAEDCNIKSLAEYVINSERGMGEPELGRELILKGLEALKKRNEYMQRDYLGLAELACRENEGLGDADLGKKIVLDGLEVLNASHSHDEGSFIDNGTFTELARFSIKCFGDYELGKKIVLDGLDYVVRQNKRVYNFIELAKFAINTHTLDSSNLGKEIILMGLERLPSSEETSERDFIELAEFAVNTNKYNGLNDIQLGKQILIGAVDCAVKNNWTVFSFINLAEYSIRYGGVQDLARKIVLRCLERLDEDESSSDSDYQLLADFALGTFKDLRDQDLTTDILERLRGA